MQLAAGRFLFLTFLLTGGLALHGQCGPTMVSPCNLGIRVSEPEMVVAVGEERPVSIESGTSFAGHVAWSQLAVLSSDESLLQVTAHPNTAIPATVRGLHPGRAFVTGASDRRFVTVTVVECPTISLEQSPASVATRPGKPVKLPVVPHGYQWMSLQWFEERNATWEPIPFATVTGYVFTPRAGTYRFQARYQDRCGDAMATFLVNATDRVRAAR